MSDWTFGTDHPQDRPRTTRDERLPLDRAVLAVGLLFALAIASFFAATLATDNMVYLGGGQHKVTGPNYEAWLFLVSSFAAGLASAASLVIELSRWKWRWGSGVVAGGVLAPISLLAAALASIPPGAFY